MTTIASTQMSNAIEQTVGVKGSDVYSSTGSSLVDLSVSLVRGCDKDTIQKGLNAILKFPNTQNIEDALVLAFQTRNVRGGKGERDLFKHMILHLHSIYPKLIEDYIVPHIEDYGSWDDVFQLADSEKCPESLREALLKFTVDKLNDDLYDLEQGKSVSLCAKWAPRETKMPNLYKQLAKMMYPEVSKLSERLKMLRKTLVKLNAASKTTEIKMCANTWADIQPKEVPGRCRMKNLKALLNETVKKYPRGSVYRPHMESNIRYPDNEDRMECREHFQEFLQKAARGEVKLNGTSTIFPHEIITKVKTMLNYIDDYENNDEMNSLIAQWNALVEETKKGGGLDKCVAMCDFSGSMSGLPKLICTALGILVAEVNGSNKILTFDSEPNWHYFPNKNIIEKVRSIHSYLGQGLSTDFQKAMDKILNDIVGNRTRPEDIPKELIVFTDMGWDQACGSDGENQYTGWGQYRRVVKTAPWQTHIQMIREAFRRTGETMWGVPFEPPRIVIWNLRAEYNDFHAKADEEGVVMLSGWSPSLFKVLQEKGVQIKTPLEALRAQLDDKMYEPIRISVRDWLEDAEKEQEQWEYQKWLGRRMDKENRY